VVRGGGKKKKTEVQSQEDTKKKKKKKKNTARILGKVAKEKIHKVDCEKKRGTEEKVSVHSPWEGGRRGK